MKNRRFLRTAIIFLLGILLINPFLVECANKNNYNRDTIKFKEGKKKWVGTWATAVYLVGKGDVPPEPGLTGNTLRQIVRVSIGGNLIRLRFSNVFSKEPVTLNSVAVAVVKEGSAIEGNTQKELTFGGQKSGIISPEGEMFCDPLQFNLLPGSRLAITIHFGNTSPNITGHPGSRTTSYLLGGNQVNSIDFRGAATIDRWYVINSIEVSTSQKAAAIAVLGNSIVDGRGTGTNKQNRWTDILSQRLLNNPATQFYGVLNLGIGGNTVVRGGLGPTALNRIDRDVFSQSGLRWLIILQGINDIGGIKSEADVDKTVKELINAYTVMINKAHGKAIKVYGGTILPFADSGYDKGYPFRQRARDEVNNWIRNSGKFDAVIDFDKMMRSEDDPNEIAVGMHMGDFLHPNEAGYRRMGESIDLNLFQ